MDKDKIKLYGLMPASDGTHPPQSYTSPTGFYVSKQKDPRKRDIIMKFCRFLTSGDNARAVKSRGVFPVRQEAMDVYKNDENIDFYKYMARVSKFAAPDASNEYYYYTWQFTMPMFQSVIAGDKSPQVAADDCAKRGTEFLAEERRRLRIDK
jgi:ABC-type glycerol-3-phosphate transport system substrate-binding protein